ncbi:MAG: hypothetical protein AB1791_19985, partial [Chloroflexota bacterium]
TLYVSQAAFISLNLEHPQPRVKVSVRLEAGGTTASYVTLDVDSDLTGCAARLSPDLLQLLGLTSDLDLVAAARLDRRLVLAEMPITIEIISPADDTVVGPSIDSPGGVHSGIPADRQLWLVIFVDDHYFPQSGPAARVSPTEWNYGNIFFGGTNKSYTVLAVLADAEASATLENYTDGPPLPEGLPVGAIIYDRVNVFRETPGYSVSILSPLSGQLTCPGDRACIVKVERSFEGPEDRQGITILVLVSPGGSLGGGWYIQSGLQMDRLEGEWSIFATLGQDVKPPTIGERWSLRALLVEQSVAEDPRYQPGARLDDYTIIPFLATSERIDLDIVSP